MQWNEGPKSFTVGTGGVSAYRLVKLTSGAVVLNTATATDAFIGAALSDGAAGDVVAVDMINKSGTMQLEAGGAITSGAVVYAGADGKVTAVPTAAGTYRKVGLAFSAASAAGSIIEVLLYDYQATTTVS